MKVKPEEKRKSLKSRKLSGRKSVKLAAEKKLPVNLLAKQSNGTSNWDQLSKIIGYDVKKPKMPTLPVLSNSQSVNELHGENSKSVTHPHPSKDFIQKHNSKHSSSKNHKRSLTENSAENTMSGRSSSTQNSATNSRSSTNGSSQKSLNKTSQNTPSNRTTKGYSRYVAMDCEMVGTGKDGRDSMLARVSLVDKFGDCIYDTYVKPMEEITDFRTSVSGIRPPDLVKGKDLYTVQAEVTDILKDRVLVGHALKNDLDVLYISHPKSMIRDTCRYKPFRQLFDGRTPSLKKLAEKLLGVDIQKGEHNSIEDAQAAMQIFLMHRGEWEKGLKHKKRRNFHKREEIGDSADSS